MARRRPTSGTEYGGDTNRSGNNDVGRLGPCRQWHIWVGRRRKCWGRRLDRVAISLPVRWTVVSTSGLCRCHFAFLMSADVGHVVSGISESGVVENVGVAAEITSPSLSVQSYFYFRFPAGHLEFRQSPSSASMFDVRNVKGDDIAPWPDANTRCTC